MSLNMFNTATEAGWYNAKIDAYTLGGYRYGYSTASYDFDPPTGGGAGNPYAVLSVIE